MSKLLRLLRTYERIAQKDHWCDTCCEYIFPGDLYSGSVYVTPRDTIMVLKQHIDPYCTPPDEPKDFETGELENLVNKAA